MTTSPRRRAGRLSLVLAALLLATTTPVSVDAATRHTIDVDDRADPYGSSTWGPSPKPGEAITPAVMGRQFVPRRTFSWPAGGGTSGPPSTLGGLYVLVFPYAPDLEARAATTR